MITRSTLLIVGIISFLIIPETLKADSSNVEKGNSLNEQGDTYKAMYYYQLALTENAEDVDALYQLAKIDFEKMKYESAIQNLNIILDIDKNHLDALILRITIDLKQQRVQKALKDLVFAEQLDSENATVQMLLENAHAEIGNVDAAKQHKQKYLYLINKTKDQ